VAAGVAPTGTTFGTDTGLDASVVSIPAA
jgi:hypothetical protein